MLIGSELYDKMRPIDRGKFPMGYCTADSFVFKEIINRKNLSFENWIKSFVGMSTIDDMEDISKPPPHGFSDESLLRALIEQWAKRKKRVFRTPMGYEMFKDNLDRWNWDFSVARLRSGGYSDGHILRPFKENYDKLKPLLDFFEVKE